MRWLTLLAVCGGLRAQEFCVTFSPQSLQASELSLGTGKQFGLWRVLIEVKIPGEHISTESILSRFPPAALFEWQARDVLDRKSAGSRRTRAKVYLDLAIQIAPAALTASGIATGTDWAKWGGLGLGVFTRLADRVSQAIPNAGDTKAHLLPDSGISGREDWSGVVVTGIVRGAVRIGPMCAAAVPQDIRKFSELDRASDVWELAKQVR